MKIRKANKKDFERYYSLKVEESKEYEKIISDKMQIPSKNNLKKEFLNFISKKNSFILLAEENKEIIAYMNTSIYKNIWSQCGYIEDIFVKREFRRKGIASNLFEEFTKILKKKKINKIILSVNIKNKNAINFYKKIDFRITKYNMERKLK